MDGPKGPSFALFVKSFVISLYSPHVMSFGIAASEGPLSGILARSAFLVVVFLRRSVPLEGRFQSPELFRGRCSGGSSCLVPPLFFGSGRYARLDGSKVQFFVYSQCFLGPSDENDYLSWRPMGYPLGRFGFAFTSVRSTVCP